ncbi:MAG TPA: alpha/beta fold hydrolase [Steroidobacteraceae bacterium]|jgi:3-oxoadipate enol-lactonase|nr:alpha/beta fold hydrolase [Steroidobacteraceae bacterium]
MIQRDSTDSLLLARDDGGWLQYATAGEGDPVVFIHGFGLDLNMWDPQWSAFAERHRVIRYDMRGYGGSSVPEGPYSHVDDLLALIDFLGTGPVHLVGLSLGGRVALRVAAAHPEAVRSLTLADPALDGHAWTDDWLQRWRKMTEAARRGDLAAAKKLWREHILFAPANAQPQVAGSLRVMIDRYSGWHLRYPDPGEAPHTPIAQMLPGISIPTLVMVGELDLPDFQTIARRLGTELPQVKLQSIPGSGHMSNMEAPQLFNNFALGFLQRC